MLGDRHEAALQLIGPRAVHRRHPIHPPLPAGATEPAQQLVAAGGGSDAVMAAVFDEAVFEPGVAPQVAEPVELGAHEVDDGDPADGVGGQHAHLQQQPVGVHDPELSAFRDAVAAVVAPWSWT